MPNPFTNDVVQKPRNIERSIAGLNDKPLQILLDQFNTLDQKEIPRENNQLSHIQFVTSRDPGYGKSHLIGRLFQQLKGKANLVYISPFGDPDTAWKSVLNRIVDELYFSEDMESGNSHTQMQMFAKGVLSQLYILLLKRTPSANQLKLIEDITHGILPSNFPDLVDKHQSSLANELDRLPFNLQFSPFSWIPVFKTIVFGTNFLLKNTCKEWIRGTVIDPDEARQIGIRSGNIFSHEIGLAQTNTICEGIISDLCHLSSLYRPFVFCFDQTENYGNDPRLAYELGNIIQVLNDRITNHMTILTTNLVPWNNTIKPHWQNAHFHRLSDKIDLEGINRQQAQDFIHQRLNGIQEDPAIIHYMTDPQWIQDLIISNTTVGIRHLIKKCRDRWNSFNPAEWDGVSDVSSATVQVTETKPTPEFPPVPEKSLADLYEGYKRKVESNPKKIIFNRDALHWLVKSASPQPCTADFINNEKYFSLNLNTGAHAYYFGFEESNYWASWNAIARRAVEYTEKGRITGIIMLRTIPLAQMPKSTWRVADFINQKQHEGLLKIYTFDKDEMIDIYAGYDLFLDSNSQNIEYTANEVLSFLQTPFQPIWNKLLNHQVGKQEQTPPVDEELEKKMVDILKTEKFLALDRLIARLNGYTEASVIAAQKNISDIRMFSSPTKRVLTWLQ